MIENNGKMTAEECGDIRGRLLKLRKILLAWMIGEFVSLILISILSILAVYENETAGKILLFVSEHDSITIALTLFCSCAALLYCVELMNLRKFNSGTLIAGIFVLAAILFSSSGGTTMTTVASYRESLAKYNYASALTSAYINSLFLLVLGLVYRGIYYTAMSDEMIRYSMPVSKAWKGLWDLAKIVAGASAVVIYLMKLLIEKFIKDLQEKNYSSQEMMEKTQGMIMILFIMVIVAALVDLILQFKERDCLAETAETLYPKDADV